jgi:SAM-dependent methyltransferase
MSTFLADQIKERFGSHYKRCRSDYSEDTAGFYPERNVDELFELVDMNCPEYFNGRAFIDIGCGIGNILYAAYLHGFTGLIAGMEINPQFLDVARKTLPPRIYLLQGDARMRTFHLFDRIFTYNPAQRRPAEFYWHIWNSIKPGAIWLETKARYMPKALIRRGEVIPRRGNNSLVLLEKS